MTFGGFVKSRHVTNDGRGDFIRDCRDDGDLPDFSSWKEFEEYLVYRHACDAAMQQARIVWKEYKAALCHVNP